MERPAMEKYADRHAAGMELAKLLQAYTGRQDAIVLALPRGGVPVAYEVAKSLRLPLDVFIVRKLGVPGHEELAMGAIATGGAQVLNDDVMLDSQVSAEDLDRVVQSELAELERREKVYRGQRPPLDLNDKVVILVDDGIATGASMRVAVKALRQFKPLSIVIAVPVAEAAMSKRMVMIADKVICPLTPSAFYAVGLYYEDFTQTSDSEVHALLNQSIEQSVDKTRSK
jgi:putative phosphoribosyl transferase